MANAATTKRNPGDGDRGEKTVLIAGAGLVGSLNACFFARLGWRVMVFEQRRDIRTMEHVPGRSINLALSYRGKCALEAVGLKEYIVEQGVAMHARLVHDPDGTLHRQPYGHPGQHINSINRRHLNEVMIGLAEQFDNVTFHFEHKVKRADLDDGHLLVERLIDGEQMRIDGARLICACDGAYSALRRGLSTRPLFNCSQEYIEHGYVELNILPLNGQFALEPNGFHLWPRGNFTLIALANIDKTFTVTIFAPFQLFEEEMNNDVKVVAFFQRHFPDALVLIGRESLIETFNRMKPQALVSIKTSPHHFGDRLLLMGDAAHAMVPFYGQGMNCGFEDCLVLNELLIKCNEDVPHTLALYSETRCRDAHAINDLAMYNYNELRDLVNHTTYIMRKKFDLFLNRLMPNSWYPLYGMVTFTRIPYHEAIERRQRQDKIVHHAIRTAAILSCAMFLAGLYRNRDSLRYLLWERWQK